MEVQCIRAALRVLQDIKSDNTRLWLRVIPLEKRLAAVEEQMKQSGEPLAIRQVYHALHEKLLHLVVARTGLSEEAFWDKYEVQTLGALQRYKELMDVWKELQQEFSLPDSPKLLWEDIDSGKQQLNVFVHDGNYPKLTYEELKEVAARYFVAERRKFRAVFMDVLELNHMISQKQNQSLYDY